MKPIRVGAASLNLTPLAWEANRSRITQALTTARQSGVSVLCLPEMTITGYGCEDAFYAPGVQVRALKQLEELLPLTRGLFVGIGLPLRHQNALFNAVAAVCDGELVGIVPKRHLAGDGLHYEPRWFKRWPGGVHTQVDIFGKAVPLGDIHFDVDGVRIGFEICEDAWVAQRPGADLAQKGVDLLLNPSASHFAFGKLKVRERLVVEGSRAFGVTYLYANLLGNESGRAIYDGGALIASGGRLIARGPRLGFQPVALTHAVVDVEHTRMLQTRTASYRPELDGDDADRVPVRLHWPTCEPETPVVTADAWEQATELDLEEFTRAITLGLFDYLQKSRARGFVVSLSGGADSTACAVLVRLGLERLVAELGPSAAAARLGRTTPTDLDDLCAEVLTCCYQATRNSSETTRHAAETVASTIGAQYLELDVDRLVTGYRETVEGAIGRTLGWDTDDITLQNIQARARGPSIWMLANLGNALLLATSNRSEAAVGYATMDGDTCGGLSPIAGIDKAFLRRWLVWLEKRGPVGRGPIPELGVVNSQQPTAELRPTDANQTDEDDLMPYPVLDAIERSAIRDKRMPAEVFRELRAADPDTPDAAHLHRVERFFRLWSRNQWKRERYAPSFHVDDENLDPKTWCRFPILSGGFELELAELRVRVMGSPSE